MAERAKFPEETVSAALERSLRNAKGLKAVNAATVAAARVLAKRIDQLAATDFVDDNGKFDNVTVPTFLKYCQSLGFTAQEARKPETRVPASSASGKVTALEDYMRKFG